MFPFENLRLLIVKYVEKPILSTIYSSTNSIIEELYNLGRKVLAGSNYIVNALERKLTKPELDGPIKINPNSSYELDFSALGAYDALVLTILAIYHENATKGLEIKWAYSPDGYNFESWDDATEKGQYTKLSFAPGEKRMKVVVIPSITNYVLVQFINLDESYPVTIYIWWHYGRWFSLPKL